MLKRLLLLAGALAALIPVMSFFGGTSGEEYARIARLEARVKRLESMLEALLTRQGIDPAEFTPQEEPENQAIHDALLRGKKIQAIKLYREQYGVGLKEAKNAIDAML